jgi:putative membrane protein
VLQANERTFLAWVRTSLAIGAAGLGIAGLAPVTEPEWVRPAIALVVTALALAFLAWAVKRFRAAEAAIRAGHEIAGLEHAALLACSLGAVLALTVLALLLAT